VDDWGRNSERSKHGRIFGSISPVERVIVYFSDGCVDDILEDGVTGGYIVHVQNGDHGWVPGEDVCVLNDIGGVSGLVYTLEVIDFVSRWTGWSGMFVEGEVSGPFTFQTRAIDCSPVAVSVCRASNAQVTDRVFNSVASAAQGTFVVRGPPCLAVTCRFIFASG
jgi:hypothetical protein